MGSDAAALAGAVLAGGRSRRMGSDKAVLEVDGIALVERAATACRDAGADPVAVVGHLRPATLPATLGAVPVADGHPGEGPLGGIVTALGWSPAPTTIVVACDLPFVDGVLLRRLAAALAADPGTDVAMARGPRGPEPLIGVWRTSSLGVLTARFGAGHRAVVDVLDALHVVTTAADARSVTNVNRPADLVAARRRHGPTARPD